MGSIKRIRVLMTGAGAPGGPGILKCLRSDPRIELLVGDANPRAAGRYIADSFVELPVATEPHFVDIVLGICRANGIGLIFPLVTRELFKFARCLTDFREQGIDVLVSPHDGLTVANDKVALYEHLHTHGIGVPDYRVATNLKQLRIAAVELGYPNRPVVIKPGVSNGSRGIRILDESRNRFDLLFDEKPTTLYSTLGEIEQIVGNRDLPSMLVSEYLPGDELTLDTIVASRDVKVVLIRTRDKMNGGISVAGRFIENDDVEGYCRRILGTLDLAGPVGMQVKCSDDGQYKVLEINPRIQGTSVAALGLGVNLPVLAVSEALGWTCAYPVKRSGIGFVRYYAEAFYETK